DCSRSCGRIVMLKMVPKTPLKFGVAERLSRTFRVESTGLRERHLRKSHEMYIHMQRLRRNAIQLVGYEESSGYPKQRYYICVLDLWSQSPGGSLNTNEGSKNSGSFEDNGRSDEEYSEYGASSKEEGSETLQVRRSTKESRAPVRYSL
ncbi:hypothetical protein Tco_0159670, partial [Tanacetum coccineum]